MEKLKRIRREIKKAQNYWAGIKCEIDNAPDLGCLSVKKEKLKNHLEEIRKMIGNRLLKCDNKIFREKCVDLLTKIFDISEDLNRTYAFPGYVESYYIYDTIKMAKY